MAEKKKGYKKKTIVEEFGESGGFGDYKEANGGGTPRGGMWGGKSGRVGWDNRKNNESMPSGAHRESQPRTSDGKFTYNSVNGKELSESSDPTRGKTVNPLLTGGENGIKIEDVEKEFSQESGSYWDKYKDKWYRKGGEVAVKEGKTFKVRVSAEAIWEVAKGKFDKVKGEFVREDKLFEETKKGRSTIEEKAAKQKAQASGKETAVIGSKGEIKLKPGVNPASIVAQTSAKPYKPKGSTEATTSQQPVSGTTINTQAGTSGISKSKYSNEDIAEATKILNSMGISLDGLSVGEIDEIIDKYFE